MKIVHITKIGVGFIGLRGCAQVRYASSGFTTNTIWIPASGKSYIVSGDTEFALLRLALNGYEYLIIGDDSNL